MNKILFAFTFFMLLYSTCYASEQESYKAGRLVLNQQKITDMRVEKLSNYLKSKNSVLQYSAGHIIKEADKYSLDYRLIPAIAGLESSFCKNIPSQSFNCWGWGIPTGASSGISFDNYNNGITIVSEGLKKKYIDRGLISIDSIGKVYAASPTWASRIKYIMEDIENYSLNNNSSLALAFTL